MNCDINISKHGYKKRGVIRIVFGIMMILFQIISVLGQSAQSTVTHSIVFYIGLYSAGIIGLFLLIFGVRAYKKGLVSQNILHVNVKKPHSVIKWIAFVIGVLTLVCYLFSGALSLKNINISATLRFLGITFFCVYSLFYMYKKPCCLFSTALILIGSAYLYEIPFILTTGIAYFSERNDLIIIVLLRVIPYTIAAALYIIIATLIYKENFSIKTIKILGWASLAMEFLSRAIFSAVISQSIIPFDTKEALFYLFTITIFFYLSIIRINSTPLSFDVNQKTQKTLI